MAACVVFMLFRGKNRLVLLLLLPVAIGIFVVLIPKNVTERLSSFSTSDAGAQAEALQSSEIRQYELTQSLTYTFQHPIFGVGPAEFALYEGTHNQVIGTHGTYRDTHNTFTEISSECGIPGFLIFVAGIVSTLLLLNVVYRQAHQRPDCNDIALALLCIMVGMIGFCVAITFLTFGYSFYLPAMGGLAIAVATGAKVEMQDRASLPSPEVVPQWFVPAPVFKRTVR
jgi:O-antigen ligase